MTESSAPTSKVGVKGQVTLPIEMRRALHLQPEDKVSFEMRDGAIVVKPAREERDWTEFQGALRQGKGISKQEMDEFIRTMRGDLEV